MGGQALSRLPTYHLKEKNMGNEHAKEQGTGCCGGMQKAEKVEKTEGCCGTAEAKKEEASGCCGPKDKGSCH